jgi:hypothetical protein
MRRARISGWLRAHVSDAHADRVDARAKHEHDELELRA